jgi:copper chaperone
METLKFKTNINCSGCLAKVTPFLNKEEGIEKWDVDIYNPEKALTVEVCDIGASEVIDAVKKAGFKIEPKQEERNH